MLRAVQLLLLKDYLQTIIFKFIKEIVLIFFKINDNNPNLSLYSN